MRHSRQRSRQPLTIARASCVLAALAFLMAVGAHSSLGGSSPCCQPPAGTPQSVWDEIAINTDWMAGPHNCGKMKWYDVVYQENCLHTAHGLVSPHLNPYGNPPNKCLALAIHAAMQSDRSHKYRAVAYLGLGHIPFDWNAVKVYNDNKLASYEYAVSHFAAAWEHDDPDVYKGRGQSFRVGSTYGSNELKDCVGSHHISSVDVPAGLALEACRKTIFQTKCRTFVGPLYKEGVGDLNDRINYVRVYRP